MIGDPDAPLPADATLGIFGGGQLGRMFCQAASELGYRTHLFSPDSNGPAAQVAETHTTADYHDFAAVDRFARSVDAVTLEFENVPVAAVEAAARHTRVRPSGEALFTVQDRIREKQFLVGAQIPCPAFASVRTDEELQSAVKRIGCPAILKTTKFGYDGKGQAKIQEAADARNAWDYLGKHACVMEQFVPFRRELSVMVARSTTGETEVCGPIENDHNNHILDLSVLPCECDAALAEEAQRISVHVANELGAVGILGVEFFETKERRLLVNEIAPRPHNSGHLTIEACETSQFEQQVRALTGLPLGPFAARQPAAMANLLGDLWARGEPSWNAIRETPGVHLHLYGKSQARPGRKMGHITALGATAEEARERVLRSRAAIGPPE